MRLGAGCSSSKVPLQCSCRRGPTQSQPNSASSFIAVLAVFILPDFPRTTTWLTEEERQLAVWRLDEDIGEDDWTSSEDQSIWHGSEAFLKNSGVAYTILQNGMYQEMIPVFAGQQVGQTGLIFFPAGDGQASYVLREELAEAAAHVLTTNGHLNQVYQLTNTASVSFYEIARELAHVLGKEVTYQSPPVNEFEARLKSGGVPDQYIGMFTMWATALSQATMDVDEPTLAKMLGRKPTSVQQFLHHAYGTN